jgi:hypothetical protein
MPLLDAHGKPIKAPHDSTPGQPEVRKLGGNVKLYRSWEAAAEASVLSRRAISESFRAYPPHQVLGSKPVLVQIVVQKTRRGPDAYLVYASRPGVPIKPGPKITAKMIDEILWWRSYDPEV